MVEIQVVRGRLKLLAEYLADLKEICGISWTDFSENKVLRRYVERTLHLAIEACIDLGNHIIATERLREPEDNRDVFRALEEAGLITPDLGDALQGAAQLRNLLLYEYWMNESANVFAVLTSRLVDLETFAIRVDDWLQKLESPRCTDG